MKTRVADLIAGIGILILFPLGRQSVFSLPSDSARERTWITNGVVQSVVQDGNRVYLSGLFTYVGPNTGYSALMDASAGTVDLSFPKVSGWVNVVAPDGSGGWYIGGFFTRVGAFALTNIAHVRSDKTVDSSWNPSPDVSGSIMGIAKSGSKVYACGGFTTIGGQTRNRIACLDSATGQATAWNPNADSSVYVLYLSGASVYAGGRFTTIGGQARRCIACLDTGTGLATSWNPNANGWVRVLSISGGKVYAGGDFTTIGGQARNYIACLDMATGLSTAWNPEINNWIEALAISGGTVFAGGAFQTSHGNVRRYFAEFSEYSPTAVMPVHRIPDKSITIYVCNHRSGRAAVAYTLPHDADVSIRLYDMKGRLLSSLVNQVQPAGGYSIPLSNKSFGTGLYVLSFRAGKYAESLPVVLMR